MKGFPLNRIILLIALALVVRAVLNYTPPVQSLVVGDPPPAFSVSVDNKPVDIETFKGAPLVIFFFANWCPCSHDSAPFVIQAAKEFEKNGLKVVAVGIMDSEEELRKFTAKHALPFPVVYDSKGEVAGKYGVVTTPSSIFIGRDWKVASILVGKIKTYGSLLERVKPLL
ncbi:MAG: TlpA family protein disulfide reductase [Nitrospirota bacterium]|nr:TlpA family protein disulfide reductase [Nitrospirota bacterium]